MESGPLYIILICRTHWMQPNRRQSPTGNTRKQSRERLKRNFEESLLKSRSIKHNPGMSCSLNTVQLGNLKIILCNLWRDTKKRLLYPYTIPYYMRHFTLWKLPSFRIAFGASRCAKSVRIRSYSGPHFPASRLNKGRYGVSLRIQSACVKMRTRITPNTGQFSRRVSML